MDLPTLDQPTAYDIAEKSQETMEWLQTHVAVGFVDERGPAWHAKEGYMADGSHFSGPVPEWRVDELLNIKFIEAPVFAQLPSGDVIRDESRKAIIREDTETIVHVAGKDYVIHPYRETLDGFVRQITFDSHAGVGSVGRLQKDGLAFLQAVLPETFEIAGYGYLPYITAVTSANGRRKTTFITGAKAAVCDNTVNMALRGAMTSAAYKHTKNSKPKVLSAREGLGVRLVQVAENLEDVFGDLAETPVSDRQWAEFLDAHVPMPEAKPTKSGTNGKGYTMAEDKRDELTRLWTKDPKVAPWANTALGVVQAVNTWRTWNGIVRNVQGGRLERNFTSDVTGANAKEDSQVIADLAKVLEREKTLAFA